MISSCSSSLTSTAVVVVVALLIVALLHTQVTRGCDVQNGGVGSGAVKGGSTGQCSKSAMSRQVYVVEPRSAISLVLDGEWDISNRNGSVTLSGIVPGNIYTALRSALLIEDPYYGYNDENYRWIAHDSWIYSRTFTVGPEIVTRRAVRLLCHGLDTVAEVQVNGVVVGQSDNQFIGYVFDITTVVVEGENTITISFQSAVEYAREAFDSHEYVVPPPCPPEEYHPECHANFIRKAQCSFSWDWGPSFPTQGIWRSITIEAFDVTSIRSVSPIPLRVENEWLLNVTVFFDKAAPTAQGTLKLSISQLEVTEEHIVTLQEGQDSVTTLLNAKNALPWWPRGYGQQTMYYLEVTFTPVEADVPASYVYLHAAFRTVEIVEDPMPNGLTFYFLINNLPIFMKGSNWIPVDSFLDTVSYQRVRNLLQSAADANMNTIRIWGGGVYESDHFYQICDELGLMVWQDMMFACSMYPVHEQFLQSVREEMKYQVRRLAYHPSLVAWTGNNENEAALVDNWYGTAGPDYPRYKSDYVQLYIDTIRDEILSEDSSRPFFSSSPFNGKVSEENGWISETPRPGVPEYGDLHYYNYISDCLDYSIFPQGRYASEYGYQSWPAYATLAKVADASELYYGSDFFQHREHKLEAQEGTDIQIRNHFTWPDTDDTYRDFKSYIYLTQVVQAICYQSETEFYRRSRSDVNLRTMGALYWQHNDIWQAPSWATIDYDGRWKMAHYYAAQFFADPMLSIIKEGNNVVIYSVTDGLVTINNVQLYLQLWSWSSTVPLLQWTSNVAIIGNGSFKIFERPLNEILDLGGCSQPEACLITCYAAGNSQPITNVNTYYPTSWKNAVGMTDPQIELTLVEQVDSMTFKVTISSSAISAFTWLESGDIVGRFSDNGFLMTSRDVTLTYYAWQPQVTVEQLQDAISVTTLWNIYH